MVFGEVLSLSLRSFRELIGIPLVDFSFFFFFFLRDGGGRLFDAGRLLTFPTYRWELTRGGRLIE